MFEFNLRFLASGLVTILILFFSYFSLQIYHLRKKYQHIPGPPANGFFGFFLGNLIELIIHTKINKKLINDLFLEWIEKHGTVIKFQVLNKIMVVTIDLQATREVLIEKNFPKEPDVYTGFGYPYGERWLGQGLVTVMNVDKWKHKRSLYNPVFHKQVLETFVDEFNSKSNILLNKLQPLADGRTVVTLFNQFNCTALDVISAVAFGMQTDTLTDPNNKLSYYVGESVKGFFRYVTNSITKLSILNPFEWFYKRKYKIVVAQLRNMGYEQIMNRLKLVQEGLYVPKDLLSITLKSFENEKFEIEEMIDDFVTFFVAGQETTANTLAFCFLELARNPDVVKKLRVEIDSVVGSRNEISNEDLVKMPYVSMCIKETLRLWPPAGGSNRRVNTDDFKINDIHIPKDSMINVSTYICGRYEKYFRNPSQFLPERFSKEPSQGENIKTYSYFPFSLGPRNCIGQNFAQMEAKIIMVKLIKNFDFELSPNQSLEAVQYATIRPLDGTKVFITPRKMS